jgi:type VI protein secretion system component VasF
MSETTLSTKTQRTGMPLWPFFALGLLLIVGWLGLKGWRIYQASQSLLERQSQIESLMANGH